MSVRQMLELFVLDQEQQSNDIGIPTKSTVSLLRASHFLWELVFGEIF